MKFYSNETYYARVFVCMCVWHFWNWRNGLLQKYANILKLFMVIFTRLRRQLSIIFFLWKFSALGNRGGNLSRTHPGAKLKAWSKNQTDAVVAVVAVACWDIFLELFAGVGLQNEVCFVSSKWNSSHVKVYYCLITMSPSPFPLNPVKKLNITSRYHRVPHFTNEVDSEQASERMSEKKRDLIIQTPCNFDFKQFDYTILSKHSNPKWCENTNDRNRIYFLRNTKKKVITLQLVVVKHSKLLCNLFDSVTKYRRIQILIFFSSVFRWEWQRVELVVMISIVVYFEWT